MKIRITVEVQDSKGDAYKRSQEMIRLAQKSIVEKFASRLVSVGNGFMDAYSVTQANTVIEVADEEPKIVSDSGVCT